jgi:uncharacterized protein
MALDKKYQQQLISIIKKYVPKCTIYLFGSRARNQEKQGSDIDLAVDAGNKIPREHILKILVEIEDTTIPMSIDLVDINDVSDDFKKQILSKGIIWNN